MSPSLPYACINCHVVCARLPLLSQKVAGETLHVAVWLVLFSEQKLGRKQGPSSAVLGNWLERNHHIGKC